MSPFPPPHLRSVMLTHMFSTLKPRLMTATVTLTVCTIGAVCSAGFAQAGDFLFQWDNDKVVDTDRHYTNGMRIGYVPDQPARQLLGITDFLKNTVGYGGFSTPSPDAHRSGWVLGQDMYTPEDVDAAVPDPRDRPYAGWTYFGASVQGESETGISGLNQQDTLELDLGIVGPQARAGETQNAFHRLINVSESQGWPYQIDTEPGILLTRMIKLRSPKWSPFGADRPGFDAIPHATGQLGNVKTSAAAGVTVRFGGNLDRDFGPIYGTFSLPQKAPDIFTWSLFAGAEARLVAHDIFLDGNTFGGGPSVKRNPLVMESRAGVMLHVPVPDNWGIKGVRIDLSHVQRSREFSTQDKSDRYGSFKLTLNF